MSSRLDFAAQRKQDFKVARPAQPSREVLATAAKRVGAHHLSPHHLRHSFGHRWLVAGGDIYTLSKLLGHSSVNVTEQHYAHLLKQDS